MGMTEKIKIALLKKHMSITELAENIGTSQSNLSNKLKRDNFSNNELQSIADALGCDLKILLIDKDTGEEL